MFAGTQPVLYLCGTDLRALLVSTTEFPQGTNTDWESILKHDLELGEDEEEKATASIGTTTDLHINPENTAGTNTSPLGLLNLGRNTQQLITVQDVPPEHFTVIPMATTEIRCAPLVPFKEKCSQTEHKECKEFYYQEHLILQRQNYMINVLLLLNGSTRENFHQHQI